MVTDAIIFAEAGEVVYARIEMAPIGTSDAIVEVEMTGVDVSTEAVILAGKQVGETSAFPCIPGFQGVGIVKATGSDAVLKPGERIFFSRSKLSSPFLDGNWMGTHVRYAVVDASENPKIGYWSRPPENISLENIALSGMGYGDAETIGSLTKEENLSKLRGLSEGNLNLVPEVSHIFRPDQAEMAYAKMLANPEEFEGVVFDWRE